MSCELVVTVVTYDPYIYWCAHFLIDHVQSFSVLSLFSVIVLMNLSGLFVRSFVCLFALYMQLYFIAEAHEQGVCGHFFDWLSPSASLSNISMSP